MCDFNNIQFMQYIINDRYFNQKCKQMTTVYIEGTGSPYLHGQMDLK